MIIFLYSSLQPLFPIPTFYNLFLTSFLPAINMKHIVPLWPNVLPFPPKSTVESCSDQLVFLPHPPKLSAALLPHELFVFLAAMYWMRISLKDNKVISKF